MMVSTITISIQPSSARTRGPASCTVGHNSALRSARIENPAHIVYGLTSGKEKFTSADSKTEERELKAGQAVWSDAVTHSSKNTGTTEDRALVIELKK